MAQIEKLIEFFNCNIITDENYSEDKWLKINKKAMKLGYWIAPNAVNKHIENFLSSKDINYNSTFYKTFNDVVSKTRFELLCDQLLHYFTTYGTDFSVGNGYVPNDGEIDIRTTFKNYKVITGCTAKDMYDKCASLLYSGIALKQSTMQVICDFIIETDKDSINVNDIKNREAQVYFCSKTNIFPDDPVALLRCIIFIATGQILLIKNQDLIGSIKLNSSKFDFRKLTEDQLIKLSTIFNRFKPLFLAFKHSISVYWDNDNYKTIIESNKSYINKIRRLSNKYHEPMRTAEINSIVSKEHSIDEIKNIISNVNNFKIISLINICREITSNSEYIMYNIRNGKSFFTTKNNKFNIDYVKMLNKVLMDELASRLSSKTCYVKYPKNVNIGAPTSEKNFVGNFPMGTNFVLDKNNYIGIYWRNEWGAHDFDLSFTSIDGTFYGWNSSYYSADQAVVYSGDMTNAYPEAAEYFYFNKAVKNGICSINRFNGRDGAKYKFIYGADSDGRKFKRGYIFDPASLIMETELVSDTPMQSLGIVIDGRFYVTNKGTGNRRIASCAGKYTDYVMGGFMSKLTNCISLNELLEYCGFVDIDTVENPDENIDIIDFRVLDKKTIIDLFA